MSTEPLVVAVSSIKVSDGAQLDTNERAKKATISNNAHCSGMSALTTSSVIPDNALSRALLPDISISAVTKGIKRKKPTDTTSVSAASSTVVVPPPQTVDSIATTPSTSFSPVDVTSRPVISSAPLIIKRARVDMDAKAAAAKERAAKKIAKEAEKAVRAETKRMRDQEKKKRDEEKAEVKKKRDEEKAKKDQEKRHKKERDEAEKKKKEDVIRRMSAGLTSFFGLASKKSVAGASIGIVRPIGPVLANNGISLATSLASSGLMAMGDMKSDADNKEHLPSDRMFFPTITFTVYSSVGFVYDSATRRAPLQGV